MQVGRRQSEVKGQGTKSSVGALSSSSQRLMTCSERAVVIEILVLLFLVTTGFSTSSLRWMAEGFSFSDILSKYPGGEP